jgi:hypothetical protein
MRSAGESMERLACNEILGNLPGKLDSVGAVLGHGFHPLIAQRPTPNLESVHRQVRPCRMKRRRDAVAAFLPQ